MDPYSYSVFGLIFAYDRLSQQIIDLEDISEFRSKFMQFAKTLCQVGDDEWKKMLPDAANGPFAPTVSALADFILSFIAAAPAAQVSDAGKWGAAERSLNSSAEAIRVHVIPNMFQATLTDSDNF